jgi:predicted ABC-type ATPase
MASKRMRVFAGPNGSGKTTIFKGILTENKVNLGVYVNADEIEAQLNLNSPIDFNPYQIIVTHDQIQDFFKNSSFSPLKRNEPDLYKKISIENNSFTTDAVIDSYIAADLAEFIRQQLLETGISFTYETVMSHPGKIDFLTKAKQKGFKVYLYYVATEDPEININRVQLRIAQDGHAVAEETIRNRYYKSLHNLKNAVKQTDRAYIFDNSETQATLVAEINDGTDVTMNDAVDIPNWVADYLFRAIN